MHAFIQIATDADSPDKLCEELKKHEEIKDLFMLFGKWDVVAIAEVKDAEDLGNFIIEKVRKIPGVSDTATQIVAKKYY